MRVYIGETRAAKLRARATANGYGVLVIRGRARLAKLSEWPFWAFDNGVFGDWRAGRRFEWRSFMRDIRWIVTQPREQWPDFVVLPDIVAEGKRSLSLSLKWLGRLRHTGLPFALAVQNGMTFNDVPWDDEAITTIFVGGSTEWKIETAAAWAAAARAHGKKCHIGRVGSARRVEWSLGTGAHSIDSALPLWSEEKFMLFERALREGGQVQMPWAKPLKIGTGKLPPRKTRHKQPK